MSSTTLTTVVREMYELRDQLAAHKAASAKETERLESEIRARAKTMQIAMAGFDHEFVQLGRSVIDVRGRYDRAGTDRASVIHDAIRQLATGQPIRAVYSDLWRTYFGTKNYDGWSGQRCDCDYGFSPRHGSIVFSVGLTEEVRKRETKVLTPEETEAAIYLLTNLERIQQAEMEVK